MTMQDNKAISRRFFEDVWNGGNLDAIQQLGVLSGVGAGTK